jgi:1,4-dihydroxy-2-naphthoyl-CoA hydrolase
MLPADAAPNTATAFNAAGADCLPGTLGIVIDRVAEGRVEAHLPIQSRLANPYGIPHAGGLVSLADTCAGYGCVHHLPDTAKGFTTIELKSNFLGTATAGTLECVATPVHLGRTTQVWDAIVTHRETGRTLAMFRCTQLLLAK